MNTDSIIMAEPNRVAGVDEAGRGSLAGPVLAAAVVLAPEVIVRLPLADSKVLTVRQREDLYQSITQLALSWSVGTASVQEIDQMNILQASLLAMRRAVMNLSIIPTEVWFDGQFCADVPYARRAIIAGDRLEPLISAASIVAKVTRDAIMSQLDQQYPGYGFAKHKGYPTTYHRDRLASCGASPIHRRTFAPVRRVLKSLVS